jgi:AmiR/NasT family two-component response regulator
VVILSADAGPALIDRLRDEGVHGFLTKPLDVKELLQLIGIVASDREADRRVRRPA